MRFFLILFLLFILRIIFLPMSIGQGMIDFLYHILLGLFMGMTTAIIEHKIDKYQSNKKNKNNGSSI
jgi:NhaP-type Na+/H+ or K+/H+ antiporter